MPPGLDASRPVLAASGAAAGAAAAGGSSAAIAPPGSDRRLAASTTSHSVAKRRFRLEKERDGTGMAESSTPVKDVPGSSERTRNQQGSGSMVATIK